MVRQLASFAAVFVLGVGTVLIAQEARRPKPTEYVNYVNRFSMSIPGYPIPTGVVATFHFPVEGDFSPNINVLVQSEKVTREQYVDITKNEFKQAGLKLIRSDNLEVEKMPAVKMEYAGKMGVRDLHFLALAVFEPRRVVLTTCTAPADSYATHAPSFEQALASFKVY